MAAAAATEKAAHPEQRHFVNVSLLLIISPGALRGGAPLDKVRKESVHKCVCVCAYYVCVCECVMIYLCCCLATESNQLEFNIV